MALKQNNAPARRKGATTKKNAQKRRVDFLNEHLWSASLSAARTRMDEVKVIQNLVGSLNAVAGFYADGAGCRSEDDRLPEWFLRINRDEIVDALHAACERMLSEGEFLKMLRAHKEE